MSDKEPRLVFVLSTGRCGTQWLAQAFKQFFGDQLIATHEPLHLEYQPRKMLALSSGLPGEAPAVVARHLDQLATLDKPYLETGHPCWSSIPYLLDQLGDRMQVVHLVRHPLPTSLSWLTHRVYVPPLLPHLEERVLLSPFDPGVTYESYRDCWGSLDPLEKCLYYWGEVNAFALRSRKKASSWLTLKYEDLFWGNGLQALLDFLGLRSEPDLFNAQKQVMDDHHYVTPSIENWRQIENHPEVIRLACQLGYDVMDIDELKLHRRYVGGD